jgi:hypothetical protein
MSAQGRLAAPRIAFTREKSAPILDCLRADGRPSFFELIWRSKE